ncbi:hypothetical protein V6N13_110925 [Hibiscus sabdariffa]|uniref:C2H2-type domain-containing protein n=1 Tax=Hibiscus sabdariffa TaxID=183260 RepID=A0ABR2TJC0_9ROSI
MEKHKCKLCAQTFSNGKALGGHMKGHLANHPLPPKTTHHHQQLSNRTDSSSSPSSSSGEYKRKVGRQWQKTSLWVMVDSRSVVQDRESETESRNPTRRRSKRKPKVGTANNATTEVIEK